MPDILRVRFLGDARSYVAVAGVEVDPDTVFDFPGRVVEDIEDADHVVIETGNPPDVRVLPRATFRVESAPKTTAPKTTGKKE